MAQSKAQPINQDHMQLKSTLFLAKIKDIEISLLELPHQFRQHFKYHPSQEYLQRINLLLSIRILH